MCCQHGSTEIGRQCQHGDLLADQFFDIAQEGPFVFGAKCNCLAIGAGARGAPDAVNIGFGHIGQFIVDDMADARHIDAARRDIGRHQHPAGASLEIGQRAFALRLALVAVDRFGNDPGIAQLAHDAIGAMFGAAEHQRAIDRLVLEHELQQRRLFGLVDVDDRLFDALSGGGRRLDRHLDRVGQIFRRQFLDRLGHGCRKEQGLALARQQADDPAQIMDEPEIEHLVGFVEDKDFNKLEIDRAALDEVEQATRGGNHDIDAAAHGAFLARNRHAAKHGGDGQLHIFAIVGERLGDLRHQFARRRQHQRAGGVFQAMLGVGGQAMQDRQRERCGLAGAGLGDAAQIMAFEHWRDCLHLNRGGFGIALVGKRTSERFGKAEVGKIGHDFLWNRACDTFAWLPAAFAGGRTSGF